MNGRCAKEAGKKLAFVDGYRNSRMVEKLGLASLPVLVELKNGEIVKTSEPKSIEDVKSFIA